MAPPIMTARDDPVASSHEAASGWNDPQVVAPNFKRRLSGVTSTIVQLVPLQAASGLRIASVGPGLPPDVPSIALADLLRFWRRPKDRPVRIWHARRNVEMIAGIVMRDLLRMKLALLFTSAAQRRHKRFTRWLLRRMDAVVATSERSAAYLAVPHSVVMHGIDTARFHPRGDGEVSVAADLPGTRLVGCFGRIRASKGTDLFVDAMIGLLPVRPGWTAVISGRVTAEHEGFAADLKTRITKAGLSERIVFIGEVPDIRPWYRALDLLVAPSRNEGFGLTPLEAMASGAPVVASDAGAYRELIVEAITGSVVPAGNGAALTSAIAAWMDDPARLAEARGAALQHARSNHDLHGEIDGLAAVYERLWSEAAAPR